MNNPSKTLSAILITGLVTFGLFCQPAHAVPLSGNITFAGTVSLDTASAGTATQVTAWHGLGAGGLPQVQSRDGGFAAFVTPGDATTFFAPWSFNSGAISTFWSVDGFTFDLITSSIATQSGGTVTVDGTGTILGHGFDPTVGTWHFTTQDPAASAQFSFSAATGTVPDGGTAIELLGLGLIGLGVMRRRFAR